MIWVDYIRIFYISEYFWQMTVCKCIYNVPWFKRAQYSDGPFRWICITQKKRVTFGMNFMYLVEIYTKEFTNIIYRIQLFIVNYS
jgi:hypothetical protein